MSTELLLVAALGLRHGLDADHLAAIDGLSRLRPSVWNGVLFALGHGGVVTVLSVGAGQLLGAFDLSALTPWLFIAIALANLVRLVRPAAVLAPSPRALGWGPLAVGAALAVGFETSSQLAALSLAAHLPPLLLGGFFTLGMVASDGVDGWLAARVQRASGARARTASAAMGWMVVVTSLAVACAELADADLAALSLPIGLTLFGCLVALRLWSLRGATPTSESP